MRNNMITKKLIKFALLFFLIGLTACDNKLNPGFDPDDYEPIVPPEPVRCPSPRHCTGRPAGFQRPWPWWRRCGAARSRSGRRSRL